MQPLSRPAAAAARRPSRRRWPGSSPPRCQYALTITIYELLTGAVKFIGADYPYDHYYYYHTFMTLN